MTSMDSVLLQLSGLTVTAGGRTLLTNLDLELRAGRLTSVSGPSGCGKSTLLRTINGLVDAPQGTIRLQKQTPTQIGWPDFRRQVVLVEQQPVMLMGSIESNFKRPFMFRSSSAKYSATLARQLLDRLGLSKVDMSDQAQSLSVGQQQRVSLIRGLMIEPKVILLDEPTSALDTEAATQVEQLVTETAQQTGLAAMVVTHAPEQARRWCDEHVDLTSFCTDTSAPGAA